MVWKKNGYKKYYKKKAYKKPYKKTYKKQSYVKTPLAIAREKWRFRAGLVRGTTGKVRRNPAAIMTSKVNEMIKKLD